MREAAETAKSLGMDYFTTTLSISPLKNAEKLNEIGDALAEEYLSLIHIQMCIRDSVVAVQPTRGLDVGAIEYIHKQLVAQRDKGKAVLLVSLELDEVMDVSDRILVMYEGEIVGELDPKKVTVEELGLYMAGAKRDEVAKKA